MKTLKINDFSIIEKTSSYNISRQDIRNNFNMANGDKISYMIRKGCYTIDLKIVCDGVFYNQLEEVLSADELTVTFTYANSEHTAIMSQKTYKTNCDTLADGERWTISLSLEECRRAAT